MHAAIARGQVAYPPLVKAHAAPHPATTEPPSPAPAGESAGLRLEDFSAAEFAALLSPVRFQRRILARSGTRADQLAALEQRLVDELRLRVVPDPVAEAAESTPEPTTGPAPVESVAETVSPTTG